MWYPYHLYRVLWPNTRRRLCYGSIDERAVLSIEEFGQLHPKICKVPFFLNERIIFVDRKLVRSILTISFRKREYSDAVHILSLI